MGETVHRAMPCGRSPDVPLLRDKSVPEGMEPNQKTAQLSHINETLTFGRDRDVRSGFGELRLRSETCNWVPTGFRSSRRKVFRSKSVLRGRFPMP